LNRIDSEQVPKFEHNESSIVNMHYQEERDIPIRNLQGVDMLNDDSENEEEKKQDQNEEDIHSSVDRRRAQSRANDEEDAS